MNEKIENKLTDIPETMLITLWAKATETGRPDALLHDEKAVEILRQIDYDFTKFRKAKLSQVGCCIRASLIDREVRDYISRHPDAVVIQLGAGLDARYQRLGSPKVTHWYDLDLSEAIALRRKFLNETERNTFIASSLFDEEWTERVQSHRKPVLIVVEGVLMYFAPEQVRTFFDNVCRGFGQTTVVFDMLVPIAVGRAKQHDALKETVHKAEFKWSLLETKEMESWSDKIRIVREHYLSDYDKGRYPLIFRLLYKLPYFYRRFNQRVVRLDIKG